MGADRLLLTGCALALLASGCASELTDPADFGVCNERRVELIIGERCAGCHGPSEPEAELDLVSPGVAARLVDVMSGNLPCAGRPRIDGGGGTYHLLFDKLRPLPGCGARMPKDGPYLSPEDTDCMGRWVADLAAGGSP